jgi:hypothetical protein
MATERYRTVTFERSVAIEYPHTQFFALGHPFVDAMLQQVGDYSFGGHTTVRVIEAPELDRGETRSGIQFSFIVRSRVQRDDGDEYLFGSHTVVVRPDGTFDDELASWAASRYSKDGTLSPPTQRLIQDLEALPLDASYQVAKERLETQLQLWDWEEDVDLIGVAKVIAVG